MKYINKKNVLHYIQNNEGHSRTNIATALSMSKPTISKLVDELISEGWVTEQESDQSSSLGGRRPYLLCFNSNAKYIFGVDIGGTTVEIALMNLNGQIMHKTSFPSQENLNNLVVKIEKMINKMLYTHNIELDKILGMGIGVPGITDVNHGVVFDAPSLGWKQYPLQSKMEKLFPFPVYIDNDVNVAVLGEQWKGAGKNKTNILQITLGTGIGCGMIINGQLYRGSSFAAGEIGYMITDKNVAEKSYDTIFSGYGFLDSHVGGPSITKRMLKKLNKSDQYAKDWSAKRIFKLAEEGDKLCQEVIQDALSHLTFGLINLITIVNPECVILGGGISRSLHRYLDQIKEKIEKHLPVKTEVTITQLENVALKGAGYLFLSEHDSILKT